MSKEYEEQVIYDRYYWNIEGVKELTENKRVVVPESDRLDVEEQTSLVEYQQQQEEDSR